MKKLDSEKRLEECREFQYSQSSKMSALSRTLIFGIIGTVWVISYSAESGFTPPNSYLFWTIYLSFIFLFTDISHYFVDSWCYKYEYNRLDKNKTDNHFVEKTHEKYMNKVSKMSFIFLICKYLLVLATSSLFAFGFFSHFFRS